MTPEQIEKAMIDPEAIFVVLENVVSQADLTTDQKIEILCRWEYSAAEEAVALEEGMPGDESDLLRRILLALGQVAGPLDLEHTGPNKRHGLSRQAIMTHSD